MKNEKCNCRTWNMARKLKKVENVEMSHVGHLIWQENMANEKLPLDDLKNDKITEQRKK
jgi:hypothetical protein